ncbi:MAG: tyrosine-type recombinase/integrase, partial [Myxococcales bacterium]|nr:tyrosine-type recombinase/integrase [Myxococcales bacterium]
VSIHALRHAYATHLIEAGLNLRAVQLQLGHACPRTTAQYVHISEKAIGEQHQRINRLVFSLAPLFLDATTQPKAAAPASPRSAA